MPSILRPRLLLLLVIRQSAGAQVGLLRHLSADAAFQNFPAGPIRGSLRKWRAMLLRRRPAARSLSLWPRQALLRLALRGARPNSMRIGSKSPSFAPSWPLFSRPSTAMNLRRVRLNGHPARRHVRSCRRVRRRRRGRAMRPPRLCPSQSAMVIGRQAASDRDPASMRKSPPTVADASCMHRSLEPLLCPCVMDGAGLGPS
jgi:hypothetical protein